MGNEPWGSCRPARTESHPLDDRVCECRDLAVALIAPGADSLARCQKKLRRPPKRRRRGGRSRASVSKCIAKRDPRATTPSAPFRNGTIFLMARPPLLRKEGKTHANNSFTRSDALTTAP